MEVGGLRRPLQVLPCRAGEHPAQRGGLAGGRRHVRHQLRGHRGRLCQGRPTGASGASRKWPTEAQASVMRRGAAMHSDCNADAGAARRRTRGRRWSRCCPRWRCLSSLCTTSSATTTCTTSRAATSTPGPSHPHAPPVLAPPAQSVLDAWQSSRSGRLHGSALVRCVYRVRACCWVLSTLLLAALRQEFAACMMSSSVMYCFFDVRVLKTVVAPPHLYVHHHHPPHVRGVQHAHYPQWLAERHGAHSSTHQPANTPACRRASERVGSGQLRHLPDG